MENIYISWHYTTHGIAYLKHILSAFYLGKSKVSDKKISVSDISQDEMNIVFDTKKKAFLYDKVYYLTTKQEAFDRIAFRRQKYRQNMLTDEVVLQQNTAHIWKDVIEKEHNSIFKEIEYVKNKYSKKEFDLFFSQLWRDMQHYTINDQVKWFTQFSNASKFYASRFEEIKLEINDLREIEDISKNLRPVIEKLKKRHKNANYFINVSLGSNETQVVWHIFSEFDFLPEKTKLLQTYDIKQNESKHRFMPFEIKELPSKIISKLSANIKFYDNPKSETYKLAAAKMDAYIKSGFAILILGERGTGKTRLAEEKKQNKKFVDVNCASFTDNSIAQSELFGHVKGAFTDAKNEKQGFFEKAQNGILFLDEIHHLSKLIQAKLMKAIQTDKENRFTITKHGSTEEIKVKTTLIFASNNSIEQLREKLLPDFYDRITQLVIEMPPLREAKKDLPEALKGTWKHMRFNEFYDYNETIGKNSKLLNWLQTLEFRGNYRDLQKITIYYNIFLDFDDKIKKLLKEKTAFEFTKNQFEKYISFNEKTESERYFDKDKTLKQIQNNFHKDLANWMIKTHGSAAKAEKYYKEKDDKITDRTIYSWKNGKFKK